MAPIVSAEQAVWMQSGVCSTVVASSNAGNRPSLGWGFGCRLSAERDRVVVFLLEGQSHAALADLRAGRPISALFTQSATTRALQLKATSAREVPLAPSDPARLDAYAINLARSWAALGQPESFTLALLSRASDTLVAFELRPEQAFDQTPGPRAGSPLRAAQ